MLNRDTEPSVQATTTSALSAIHLMSVTPWGNVTLALFVGSGIITPFSSPPAPLALAIASVSNVQLCAVPCSKKKNRLVRPGIIPSYRRARCAHVEGRRDDVARDRALRRGHARHARPDVNGRCWWHVTGSTQSVNGARFFNSRHSDAVGRKDEGRGHPADGEADVPGRVSVSAVAVARKLPVFSAHPRQAHAQSARQTMYRAYFFISFFGEGPTCHCADVYRSLIGLVLFAIPFIVWFIVFQVERASWGATGDTLSFTIPRGY